METQVQSRPFKRVHEHRRIAGICGGLAYAFGIQPVIIRLIFVFIALGSLSLVFWAYLLAWLVVDKWVTDPADFDAVTHSAS